MLALQTPEDMFFMLYGHGRDIMFHAQQCRHPSGYCKAGHNWRGKHAPIATSWAMWWDQQFKKHCFLSRQWFLAIVSNWKPAAIHIDRTAWKHIWRQANSQFPTWPLIRCTQPAFALHVHPMLSPRMKRTPWSLLVFPGGPIIRVLLK